METELTLLLDVSDKMRGNGTKTKRRNEEEAGVHGDGRLYINPIITEVHILMLLVVYCHEYGITLELVNGSYIPCMDSDNTQRAWFGT